MRCTNEAIDDPRAGRLRQPRKSESISVEVGALRRPCEGVIERGCPERKR